MPLLVVKILQWWTICSGLFDELPSGFSKRGNTKREHIQFSYGAARVTNTVGAGARNSRFDASAEGR